MAAATYELLMKIGGQLDSSLAKSFGSVTKSISGIQKASTNVTEGVSKSFGKIKGLVLGGAAALGAGISVNAIVDAAGEQEKAMAQLNAVLKSTKDVSGMSKSGLTELSEGLSKTTEFTKDTVLGTENMMLTFTKVGKNIFPQATQTALDMSQALGQDTKSSAIQLGKALNDPVNGITALKRVGVTFTDAQQKQIKALVASGKTMDAQKVILKELQTEFGGSAKAAGQTFAGQVQIAKNAVHDTFEEISDTLVPFIASAAPVITNAVKGFGSLIASHQGDIKEFFGNIVKLGQAVVRNLEPAFNSARPLLTKIWQEAQGPLKYLTGTALPALGKAVASMMPPLLRIVDIVVSKLLPVAMKGAVQIVPVLAAVAGFLGSTVFPIIEGIANFAVNHSSIVIAAVIAIGAAVKGVQIAKTVMGVTKALGEAKKGVEALKGVAKGGKILANLLGLPPQALVVIGIIAVVAAGAYLIIKNWSKFSKFFEGLWKGIIGIFSKAWAWLKSDTGEAVSLILAVLLPFIGIPLVIAEHWKGITKFFAGLGAGIAGIFQKIWAWLTTGMGQFVTVILAVLLPFIGVPLLIAQHWNQIGPIILGILKFAVNIVKTQIANIINIFSAMGTFVIGIFANTFGAVFNGIKQYIGGIINVFKGIITFIRGVFTGNWKEAWTGVQQIFGGIFQALGALVKTPLNVVIGLINAAIGGLNKLHISIPKGIPIVGGLTIGGFNIPKIPQLATGGVVQHRPGGILANIGEGSYDEAVVPLKNSNSGFGNVTNILQHNTNSILSDNRSAGGGSNPQPAPSGGSDNRPIQFIYSPNIQVKGDADKKDMEQVAQDDFERFKKFLEQYFKDKKRVKL